MDRHAPRRPLDLLSFPGQLVERLALVLEGGIHRGDLLDGAAKGVHGGLDGAGIECRDVALAGHSALDVTGFGGDAQARAGLVGFARVQHERRRLAGLAKADRQQAGGEGVERAGMAGFARRVKPTNLLNGLVGGHAGRLVQQQHAVDVAALPAPAHQSCLSLRASSSSSLSPDSALRSEEMAVSINSSMWRPVSTEASW